MDAMEIATTGLIAQQVSVDVIANNLANLNTTGFMRREMEFRDLLYEELPRDPSTSSPVDDLFSTGVESGYGVELAGVIRIHEQGMLNPTGNTLDLGIKGKGFFQIELPNGETAYTRDGTFQLNDAGEIVTHKGYSLQPGITVPVNAREVSVNDSGEVLAKIEGQSELQNLGQIQLAIFASPGGLKNLGDNLLGETEASGPAATGTAGTTGYGTILQGFLESSNVNAIQEITNMIKAYRAYEMNAKVIETADQMSSASTS